MSEETTKTQHGPLIMPCEAAAMLGLSATVLKGLQRTGGVPPRVRIGRKVRYRSADIEAMLAANAEDHCNPPADTAGTP